MKKVLLILAIVTMAIWSTQNANAISINITPPQIDTSDDIFDAAFNSSPEFTNAFNTFETEAETTLGKYSKLNDLATGFANANAYASHAGSLPGYQNYSLFSVSAGVMVGVQAPSMDTSYYDKLGDKLSQEGDLYAGVSAGISFVNVGINAGFLLDGLYLSGKFGSLNITPVKGDNEVSISSTLIGIGANYALIREHGLGYGLFKWRGLSIGSGFIYQKNEVDFTSKLDPITSTLNETVGIYTISGTFTMNPSLQLGLDLQTYTIPFEIVTSIQALWILNFSLGAGIDLTFGNSDIIVKSKGTTNVDSPNISGGPATINAFDAGSFTVDASTKNIPPSFIRPRLMASVGLNITVVKVDLIGLYYPMSGAAVGLSAGVVW